MDNQTAAPSNGDTANVITPPAQAQAGAEPGRRNPESGNKYDQEVESLLTAYEAKRAKAAEAKAAEAKAAEAKAAMDQGLLEGESWDQIFKSQPPEVQRAMAQVRADYTRKTQALAAERQRMESLNRALIDSPQMQKLHELAGKMPADFDPFNPEHINAAIEAKVAERLAATLEPLRVQNAEIEAKGRYEQFRAEHPDLLGDAAIKEGVTELLQRDTSISLENAYYIVKGKLATNEQAQQAKRNETLRRAAKTAALIPQSGNRTGRPVVEQDAFRGLSGPEIYDRLKAAR